MVADEELSDWSLMKLSFELFFRTKYFIPPLFICWLFLWQSLETKKVIQFHYTAWPDFGVPESPCAFLDFLYAVRESGALDDPTSPSVIHCSAGIGRSGTFCLVDACLVQVSSYRLIRYDGLDCFNSVLTCLTWFLVQQL